MRKVSKEIAQAFKENKKKSISNTNTDGTSIYLFGNKIVRKISNNKLEISLCGFNTTTTKERLNTVLDRFSYPERISQKKEKLYLGNQEIDSCQKILITFN